MYAGGLLPPNWEAIDKIFDKVSNGLIKSIGDNVYVSQTTSPPFTAETLKAVTCDRQPETAAGNHAAALPLEAPRLSTSPPPTLLTLTAS